MANQQERQLVERRKPFLHNQEILYFRQGKGGQEPGFQRGYLIVPAGRENGAFLVTNQQVEDEKVQALYREYGFFQSSRKPGEGRTRVGDPQFTDEQLASCQLMEAGDLNNLNVSRQELAAHIVHLKQREAMRHDEERTMVAAPDVNKQLSAEETDLVLKNAFEELNKIADKPKGFYVRQVKPEYKNFNKMFDFAADLVAVIDDTVKQAKAEQIKVRDQFNILADQQIRDIDVVEFSHHTNNMIADGLRAAARQVFSNTEQYMKKLKQNRDYSLNLLGYVDAVLLWAA